ncbi:2-oxo acid dehydrogenase subunit E2 [Nocardia vinacea]|uniref:Dihydrolipoamide acetyltransferase component of pyruvate dehydrogenase complex n=1 Tax=Nocardia vinacea TaxID=96468 RepID=A0ABZ1YSX8_9NOCA|nr:dihydrolipoamide acetyltransferase family protein [Nocardia vinacea]
MTTTVVALADVGEGITDAVVLEWKVAPGDPVHTNQTLLEIETVKAIVEVPAPCDGIIASLDAEEGDTVPVGAALATIATDSAPPESPATAPLAKPSVRKYAREHDIDLAEVVGTGPQGQITEQDVADYRAHRDADPTPAAGVREIAGPTPVEGQGVADPPIVGDGAIDSSAVAVSAVRRATAEAVTTSFFSAPHATVFLESDATATVEFVDRLRLDVRFHSPDITALAVVAAAVTRTAVEIPEINSAWDGVSPVITRHHTVNLGIAVATERGLLVPNIKNAQHLSVIELAAALTDTVARARAGRIAPAEFADGTITISNVGSLGIDTATPIVNRGESAIICVGAIRKRPWVIDDAVVPRSTAPLSLSFDHRLIDGDTAAHALRRITEMLREPLWHLPVGVKPSALRG